MPADELCAYGRMVARDRLKALLAEREGVRAGEDIECVHRMRVASRRLRSTLRMFQECFKGKKGKRWRRAVKEVTSNLGEARDLDVQIEHLSRTAKGWEGEEAVGLALVIEVLRCRRSALQPSIAAFMDALEEEGPLMEMSAELEDEGAWKGEASSLRPSAFAHASVAVEELLSHSHSVPVYEDWQGHHALRIAGKHLRYALEVFRGAYEDHLDEEIGRLKELQDAVGELHDCDVWLQRLPSLRQEVPLARSALDRLQLEMEEGRRALHGRLREAWGELEQDRFLSRLLRKLRGSLDSELCPLKVALISDVHGNEWALRAVLDHARGRGATAFLHAGDSVGLPRTEGVIALLRGAEVLSVVGNMDLEALTARKGGRSDRQTGLVAGSLSEESVEWLASLPDELRLDVCGRTVYVTHAAPGEREEKILPTTPVARLAELASRAAADVVVTGHSHIPMTREASGTLFVNPGSVGRPRDGPEASYALMDFPSQLVQVHRVPYDSAGAAEEIAAHGLKDVATLVAQGKNADSLGAVAAWAAPHTPDAAHVEQVRTLALLLFDHTRGLHRMKGKERDLLEMAALAHDAGLSQGADGHQRRVLDMIMEAELPLGRRDRMMVACVARYHGCQSPRDGDRVFRDLKDKERRIVRKLSALLALADALDRGHDSRVSGMDVRVTKKELRLGLRGHGPFDLEMEWAGYKAVQFEKAFGRRVELAQ